MNAANNVVELNAHLKEQDNSHVALLVTVPQGANPRDAYGKKQFQLFTFDCEFVSQSNDRYSLIAMFDSTNARHAQVATRGLTECRPIEWQTFLDLKNAKKPVAAPFTANIPARQIQQPAHRSQFSVSQRYAMLDSYISMVARKRINGLIICGQKGLGKTTRVTRNMDNFGLTNILENDGTGDYLPMSGFTTAKALYRKLYELRDGGILIPDDLDWKDSACVELLKKATDTTATRWICWNSDGRIGDTAEKLPQAFEFKGAVIIVTNWPEAELQEMFGQRSPVLNMYMTNPELIEYMETVIATDPEITETYAADVIEDSLQLIRDNIDNARALLNLRTFKNILQCRAECLPNWRDMATFGLFQG